MELPETAVVLEEEIADPKVQLDEEDTQQLICDCHELLEKILDRTNPKWLQSQGSKLIARLEESLGWYKLH